MLQNSLATQLHHRRPPAYLSVSLRHESPSTASSTYSLKAQAARDEETRQSSLTRKLSAVRRTSEESNDTGESRSIPPEVWFDRSNKNVGGKLGPRLVDDDPPFFMQNQGVPYPDLSANNEEVDNAPNSDRNASQFASNYVRGGTSGSSMDDFRSVIDDLTIQNKKLKDKLRKYERIYDAHLEKDRLFEIKFHGLHPDKKRELEETLHAFASSIRKDESVNDTSSHLLKDGEHMEISLRHTSKKPSSTSTNSRLVDSAYASLSTSGHVPSSAANHVGVDKEGDSKAATLKMDNIQNVPDDIPQGLLPKNPTVMSERGKKKLVVRRLEQLFTGKLRVRRDANSQPKQQQEVSNSAARDDRQALQRRGQQVLAEGVREAHIQDAETELEGVKLQKVPERSSTYSLAASRVDGRERLLEVPSSPNQRPTRPLDLDPDRVQVPADNIEYIRHLGISTPIMTCEDPADIMVDDSHGWVYLNLLINMAQLHIINVTPGFIRSAVSELSTKFQLSQDGRKIRWRGGTEGTELSSDSGADNALRHSPNDSDSLDEGNQKKRKIGSITHHVSSTLEQMPKQGRFSSIPINGLGQSQSINNSERRRNLHYKPLFAHRSSSEGDSMSLDVDDCTSLDDSGIIPTPSGAQDTQRRSQSGLQSKRKRNDGAIVFYSGAPFCVDLSGDRDSISTPLHVSAVDIDGFSNHSYDALGCKPKSLSRPPSFQTASKSLSPSQIVENNSVWALPNSESNHETRSSTPELVQSDEEAELEFSPQWLSTGEQHNPGPIRLEACGLGGTRPFDHFAYVVETRWRKLDERTRLRLSKYPRLRTRSRRFLHVISKSSLDEFRSVNDEDEIPSHMGLFMDQYMSAHDSTPLAALPLQAEILCTRFQVLEASTLPPPANFHGTFSSSTEWSSDSSSGDDGDVLNGNWQSSRFQSRVLNPASPYDPMVVDDWNANNRISDVAESEDSSIDILAHARKADPDAVAIKEQDFEREILLQSDRKRLAIVDHITEASSVESSSEESEAA